MRPMCDPWRLPMLNMLTVLALARFVFDLTFDFGTVLVIVILAITVGTIILGIKNSGSGPEKPTGEATTGRIDSDSPTK
jgi:hypothetical protein